MRVIVHGDNGVPLFSFDTRKERRSSSPDQSEKRAVIAALGEALSFLYGDEGNVVLSNGKAVADGQPGAYPMRRGI